MNPSNDSDKDRELVQQLLDLKEYVDSVASECFGRQDRFLSAIKESFESFINERQNKPAEMLGIHRQTVKLLPVPNTLHF